jgi:hypothetical protein
MSLPSSQAEPNDGQAFHPDFQRALLAMRYLLGTRGGELLGSVPSANAVLEGLFARLAHPDRARRADALAFEIGQVVRALEARTFR